MARDTIRFLLDGRLVEVRDLAPTITVLQYLRETLHRIGTKEGCAEGDCGACTVVLAEAQDGRLAYRAINACIRFLPTLDGQALFTVESLKRRDGRLHPVQQALVDYHGSQCGFCTPGFVMSLFALYKSEPSPSRARIDDALSGNLCRCTGYRPIIAAAEHMHGYGDAGDAEWLVRPCGAAETAEERALRERLEALCAADSLAYEYAGQRYFAPTSALELAAALAQYPEACLLAGGTDVGLWVTKQHRDLPTLIYTGRVAELHRLARGPEYLEIGAAVSLQRAFAALIELYPQLAELCLRFASPPIRNSGTLGGNIANGSPIGDSMPALIALGSRLVLNGREGRRELALEDYYLAYQKTARRPGEFVESVKVPLPRPGWQFATYKVSKRFDQDISAVCGAFCLELRDGRIGAARVAYGGMAATVKRALQCEQALAGQPWSAATVEAAAAALAQDYQPISDLRASQDYRQRVAANLLHRFYLETSDAGLPTRVVAYGR